MSSCSTFQELAGNFQKSESPEGGWGSDNRMGGGQVRKKLPN